ncbi:hypothetical protein ARMSODRAFT_1026904 [Armillaria solidipes]|uniref:Uncharacterized protein n=1 Tax=Armillaria solidipes TaxID=1076256 RepID=A0A2H3AQU4_9AGAR|nr:hypothetical protein ARMSODRAFT_1026904 [Armillaria solidipes]
MLLEPLAAMSGTYLLLPHVETVHWEEEFVDKMDGVIDVIDVILIRDMTAPEPTERAASLIQREIGKTSCAREVSRLGVNPGRYLRLLGPTAMHPTLSPGTSHRYTQPEEEDEKVCNHNEYDALDDLLAPTNKATVKLQQQLSPSSAFHERCDSEQLKNLVEEASSLVSSLPFKAFLELDGQRPAPRYQRDHN